MNGKTQAAYAPEFKQQIVELYASGRGPGELAREFGCSEASVHAWVKKAGTMRIAARCGQSGQDCASSGTSGSCSDGVVGWRA